MSDRLPSGTLVGALLRRVNDAGGIGMVLAKGDAQGGAILILTLDKGRDPKALERGFGPDGKARLTPTGPSDTDLPSITDYWRRRRTRDPDLWVIELDTPFAERFAAETMCDD